MCKWAAWRFSVIIASRFRQASINCRICLLQNLELQNSFSNITCYILWFKLALFFALVIGLVEDFQVYEHLEFVVELYQCLFQWVLCLVQFLTATQCLHCIKTLVCQILHKYLNFQTSHHYKSVWIVSLSSSDSHNQIISLQLRKTLKSL